MTSGGLAAAARDAARFLTAVSKNGAWNDFELPVGTATDWTTAVVAGVLQGAADAGVTVPSELGDVLAAADKELGTPEACAWGYNRSTQPDADSTAHALLFLSTRRDLPHDVRDFLRRHWRETGFATFEADDAWGDAHPCVTPVVALALDAVGGCRDRDAIVAAVESFRRDDGTWPAYWWRGSHYSTFWNLVLMRHWDIPVAPMRPVIGGRPSEEVRSVLDLACVVGITTMRLGVSAAAGALELLIGQQLESGGFAGGRDLRVTHHTCHTPWETPVGELYFDQSGILTTAMALRVMTLLLRDSEVGDRL